MSGSRSVITPSWLYGSWRSFLYSSVYSCHLFLISPASVRSIPFLSFIVPIFAWNVPLVSLIFLKRKNLPTNAGDIKDLVLIPGSGRSPGVGNGNPFQYAFLENPIDRGAWWAIVKWALGSITTNKASGGDGIPIELFQILKDNAVKVPHSICQQIWKTQHWPQDSKRSVFVPIPKKGNAKECSNYHTISLLSHAGKVMLKIL